MDNRHLDSADKERAAAEFDCVTLGWDLGALWTLDPTGQHLYCVDAWHAPGAGFPRFEEATRNREATGRFAWSPYMHDPKLKGRLHRIRVPALVLWGAADRIASEHYGRAYCAALPHGRFELIERAGHYPHLEQPDEFARRVHAFTK